MKIGIIGAMVEEITPLLEFFKDAHLDIQTQNIGGSVYHCINIKQDSVYIAYSKIGKVHSALVATMMIAHFGCEKILFSGVAGGLRRDLVVGDLLIATKLCQHDVNISAFGHPLGFIPESAVFIESDSELNAIARSVASSIGKELKEGIIASGDQFINDNSKKQWISQTFDACAVEMEGASVAVVCAAFSVPFCIFRSISDSADTNADISFDEFLESASKVSARFCIQFIKKLGVGI